MIKARFEWDEFKNLLNQAKHGVSFEEAQYVFLDEKRILAKDAGHSKEEDRFYCIGHDLERADIITVRFTYRKGQIQIIGAGYWRKWRKIYARKNRIQR